MAYLGLPSALMMEASVFCVMARGIMAKMITPYSCAICMFASVAPIRRSRPSPHRQAMAITITPEKNDPRAALPTLLWISFVSPRPRETLSAAAAPSPKNRLNPHPTTVIGKITPVAALPRQPTPLPTNIWSTMLQRHEMIREKMQGIANFCSSFPTFSVPRQLLFSIIVLLFTQKTTPVASVP